MVNGISQKSLVPDMAQQRTPVSNVVDIRPEGAALNKAAQADKAKAAEEVASQQNIRENLESTVNQLNDIAQSIQRDLKFSVDESSGQTIISVVDTQSQEVIRQIPPDYVLNVRENIESLKGILFSAEI
jgi:flagellar protein FlaG